MSITGLDILLFVIIIITPLIINIFTNWFRKTKKLDENIPKEYTVLNEHRQTARTYNLSTGEFVSERSLGNALNEYHNKLQELERAVAERNIEHRALITRQQYEMLRSQGRDIIDGAESHIKPESKEPKGYTITDQFDEVP